MKAANQVAATLRLRGTTIPVIALAVRTADPEQLEDELARKVLEADGSLAGGLGVIDLSALTEPPPSLAPLAEMVRRFGMRPVAVLGADEAFGSEADALGLALLPAAGRGMAARNEPDAAPAPIAAPEPVPPPVVPEPLLATAMLLDRPLRSGQRVYARGRDLVLLAGASPGSELIADGNIHCYGPLRGRAMAGASGDTSAHVFALDFQAELVSIAGIYKSFEQLSDEFRGRPVRASLQLEGEQRRIVLSPLGDR
ncbi:septum site-determining protein MinC [Caldimonas tepidiphila]|uniref:septum site-determining protein MinC n=1 Tax=Caldimonas tepidiphila TaxID=2315841 RepID=UPI000E5AF758|nr:septum site-determining protein MinC [Caldimonas tepidiphila]